MGRAVACSKEMLDGFNASPYSDADAYSANAPRHQPNTSSPGRNRVTPAPTASTCPATSVPRIGFFGLRNPYDAAGRAMYGRPLMIAESPGLTAAAQTRTKTSWSPIAGLSTFLSSRTSLEPYRSWTIAFMVSTARTVVGAVGVSSVVACMVSPNVVGLRCSMKEDEGPAGLHPTGMIERNLRCYCRIQPTRSSSRVGLGLETLGEEPERHHQFKEHAGDREHEADVDPENFSDGSSHENRIADQARNRQESGDQAGPEKQRTQGHAPRCKCHLAKLVEHCVRVSEGRSMGHGRRPVKAMLAT